MSSILLKPRMSEKTYAQSQNDQNRVFVFDVDSSVNKHDIAKAVEDEYNVTVKNVNVSVAKGKVKRLYKAKSRKYETGTRTNIKKAYVTLKEGDSIPIFAAVEEAEKQEEKVAKKSKKSTKKKAKKGKD